MNSSAKIELEGIELDVEFYYTPSEPQTNSSPGYREDFEDIEVFHKGENITALFSLLTYEAEIKKQLKNLR